MKKKLFIVSIFAFFAVVWLQADKFHLLSAENTSLDSQVDQKEFAVGNLKGIPVAVPRKYIFFPIQYEGEDVWRGKKIKGSLSLETPIRVISLRMQLPSMSSLTSENEMSWHEFLEKPSKKTDWITVDLEARKFDVPGQKWVKDFIDRSREIENRRSYVGWHYQKKIEKQFGLTVEMLVGGNNRPKYWIADKNLLYDEQDWDTIVQCQTHSPRHEEDIHRCTQYFPLPEMNAYATVKYTIDQLKGWKKIQKDVTTLVMQFVIKK